jgi:hypothetical protein
VSTELSLLGIFLFSLRKAMEPSTPGPVAGLWGMEKWLWWEPVLKLKAAAIKSES